MLPVTRCAGIAMTSVAPSYSAAERLADAAVHGAGLLLAVGGGAVLLRMAALSGDRAAALAVAVYAASLLATFVASAAYNLAPWPTRREMLRRLDHAAIFVKIAGTYTPFCVLSLWDGPGRTLLLAVWSAALVGAAVKLAAPRRFEIGSILLYLALGWSFLPVAAKAAEALPPLSLWLLLGGGVLYTLGVAFHLWDRLPFQNAIWHGHVVGASACMFAAVAVQIG